eukprot:2429080-Prorocentrum_lima.AAC.1
MSGRRLTMVAKAHLKRMCEKEKMRTKHNEVKVREGAHQTLTKPHHGGGADEQGASSVEH